MFGIQFISLALLFSTLFSPLATAHPISESNNNVKSRRFIKVRNVNPAQVVSRNATLVAPKAKRDAAFDELFSGNQKFRETVQPGLLKQLTDDGQSPPFMFIGCSDSRVSEGTIFNAKPGTLFTERNIANQFSTNDANSHSVLSYAVAELGVTHVVVMGHYGCGGVAAAIATPPEGVLDSANGAVQNWIAPIRKIFQTSTRPEIVALREKNAGAAVVEEPEPQEPGFRALVEENVKASVASIASSTIMTNHFIQLKEVGATARRAEGEAVSNVFVHGMVYDIETGEIFNLGVSVGPPGVAIPEIPFGAVKGASEAVAAVENSSAGSTGEAEKRAACEGQCKSKRGLFW